MKIKLISMYWRQLAFVLFLAFFSGCGSDQLETYTVNGKLNFEDGTTPEFGVVEFYNAENGINARGDIQRDGTFTVSTYRNGDGAVAGRHEIVIIQNTGTYLTADLPRVVHEHGALVDPDYGDYRSSGLECTIGEDDNDFELTLRRYAYQTEDGLPPGNPPPVPGN